MATLTFQGGAVEIVIYKNGDEVTIDNFPEFFRSVAEVRAEVRGGETSKVIIKLTPNFQDGLLILRSGLLGSSTAKDGQLPGSGLSAASTSSGIQTSDNQGTQGSSNLTYYAVRFFYIGGDTTPWYGGVTCSPAFTFGAEMEFTLTISGIHNMMAIGGGPHKFENQSALDVLNDLASAYGIGITFDDDDNQTEDLLSNAMITGHYNEDYDGVIRRILNDLRCVYTKYDGDGDDPKPQYRVKAITYLTQQPNEYRFVWMRQVFPELGDVPVEEISLESLGVLLAPGSTFGTFSRAVLSRTKEIKTQASSPSDFTFTPTSGTKSTGGAFPTDTGDGSAKGGATGLVDTSRKVSGMDVTAVHRDEASTLDRAGARSEIDTSKYLVFHVKIPGLPGLRPLSAVQLLLSDAGNGLEAFCGSFSVMELTHDWSSNGWTTEAKIHKTGGLVFNSAAAEKASDPPNVGDDKVTVKATAV